MAILNVGLAQDIVRRTMDIIPFNVNVMDAHGVILASGDVSRVGELHSGALVALAKETVVEVDTVMAKQMHGTKPGVNLPLLANGKLVGAVGLSGRPSEVRQFGALVKLTAEMILEQAHLTETLQRHSRYRESFLLGLIQPHGQASADIDTWGQRLGFDFERTHVAFLLELAGSQFDVLLNQMHSLQAHLSSHQPELLTAVLSPNEMVILASHTPPKNRRRSDEMPVKFRQGLFELLKQACQPTFVLSMGLALAGQAGIQVSYLSAKTTAKVGRLRHPERQMHAYDDLALPVLLSGLNQGWQADQLCMPLRLLQQNDKPNKMLEATIHAWFAHNQNANQTAHALGIHRNSLDYRLRRIEHITGMDLNCIEDSLFLYVSSLLTSGHAET